MEKAGGGRDPGLSACRRVEEGPNEHGHRRHADWGTCGSSHMYKVAAAQKPAIGSREKGRVALGRSDWREEGPRGRLGGGQRPRASRSLCCLVWFGLVWFCVGV